MASGKGVGGGGNTHCGCVMADCNWLMFGLRFLLHFALDCGS